MTEEKIVKNARAALQRKYRESQHKDFLEKEESRQKSLLPEGSKKINGRIYIYHSSYEKRNDAEETAKNLKANNLTHVEKTKKGWSIYLFPI